MNISKAKINRAIKKDLDREYKQRFHYDSKSDSEYVYVAVDAHYIIRVPVDIIEPDVLEGIKKHEDSGKYWSLEALIKSAVHEVDSTDFEYKEVEDIVSFGKPITVANFWSIDQNRKSPRVSINVKFFKEFYNKSILEYGISDNITFTGVNGKAPLVMWEDDDAVALFLPINRKG